MAKNPKADENAALAKDGVPATGVVVPAHFDDIEVVNAEEGISLDEIMTALADPATGEVTQGEQLETVIAGGTEFFWPAARGLVLRGKILGREERQTTLMVDGKAANAFFYVVELTRPALGVRSSDVKPGKPLPRPVQCNPGIRISVLERTILKRLQPMIGSEAVVVCDGPAKTKRGLNLWLYRAWRVIKSEVVDSQALSPAAETPALPAAGT